MSEDELKKLREKRLREMQQVEAQKESENQYNDMQTRQQDQYQAQIHAILGKILSSDARVRLTNIRMSRPQFAQLLESQLIGLYQRGSFGNNLPLSDKQFKEILVKLQQQTKKRDGKIHFR